MTIAKLRPVHCAKCNQCSIHNRAICRAANGETLDSLNSISYLRSYKRDETIIRQGDDEGIVGNVVSGILKLTKATGDGQNHIVGLLYPSDFFGRLFENHQEFAVEAATDVTLCCMDRRRFEQVLAQHAELEHELLVHVLEELDATREMLAMRNCKDTMGRVATFLMLMLKRASNQTCPHELVPPEMVVSIPITRRDLAGYLGTTIETISRHIHKLSRNHIIQIIDPRHFVILDQGRLLDLAGEFDDDLTDVFFSKAAAGR